VTHASVHYIAVMQFAGIHVIRTINKTKNKQLATQGGPKK